MPKAVWDGTVIAENDRTVVVEGNHYFHRTLCIFLRPSEARRVLGKERPATITSR